MSLLLDCKNYTGGGRGEGLVVCHAFCCLTVGAEWHAWLVFTAAADLTRKESVTSSFAPFRGLVKLLHKSTPVGCLDPLFFCLPLRLEGGIVKKKKPLLSINKSLGGRCVEMRPAQLSIWRMCWHGHGAPLRWNFNSFKWKPEQLQKQTSEPRANSLANKGWEMTSFNLGFSPIGRH